MVPKHRVGYARETRGERAGRNENRSRELGGVRQSKTSRHSPTIQIKRVSKRIIMRSES